MKLDHTKHLNRQEAERAVYLDFESHKEGPPFLAGVLVEDTILQVTFDPTLQIAARQAPRGTETGSLAEFVDGLLERCEQAGEELDVQGASDGAGSAQESCEEAEGPAVYKGGPEGLCRNRSR